MDSRLFCSILLVIVELLVCQGEGAKLTKDTSQIERDKREPSGLHLSDIDFSFGLEDDKDLLQNVLRGIGRNSYKISPSAIANQAAGEATAIEAAQDEAAYKAAQAASRKVAAKASSAAQAAQAAAATKYSQAAQLTKASQMAQAIMFKEAAQAAKTGKTVQAAKSMKMLALSQLSILQQAMDAAEAQVAIAQQVLSSATAAYMEQITALKKAQEVAQKVVTHQNKAVNELSDTQAAAERAKAAASKALYRASPVKRFRYARKS